MPLLAAYQQLFKAKLKRLIVPGTAVLLLPAGKTSIAALKLPEEFMTEIDQVVEF